jgi:methyl-accepting chemotaxis protein
MSSAYEEAIFKFDLNGESRTHLKQAGTLVIPLLPAVLDRFYDIIAADPEMAKFFSDQAMIDKAKAAQQNHWKMLLSGEFPEKYFDSAYRIGRVHPRIGLPFLFYLSGYAHATSHIQEILLQTYGGISDILHRRNLPKILSVLTRAFALDTHLVLDAHFAAEKEEQELAFSHLTGGIQRMAARDLTRPIPSSQHSDYPARYNPVREAFNSLMATQRKVLATIQASTFSLNRRAAEVAESAEDLSRRTETQAATLEETAAAVEEITVSMKSSAEATNQTDRTVSDTRQSAMQGIKVAQEAIQKMQEIEASSRRISQIINVIDDIAFQTNLLALNAGVEAARAGETGRGFAVVASEVRALAQRSADSANEIKALINISSGHVDGGVSLVNETGKALEKMSIEINRTAELTSEIASSAQQQATGLSEINVGVAQLDQVTQKNAAMVEEATAAALSMQQDITILNELVGSFKVSNSSAQDSASDGSRRMAAGANKQAAEETDEAA